MINTMEKYDRVADCYEEADLAVECKSIAEAEGLDYIRGGDLRSVFANGNTVVKFAHGVNYHLGVEHNKREREVWEEASSDLQHHLAAVELAAGDDRWLVMERVDDQVRGRGDSVSQALRTAGYRCPDLNVGRPDYRNLGTDDNGKVVALDYGDCQKD